MADIKWSAFSTTGTTTPGDTLVGLHSGNNYQFSLSTTPSGSGLPLYDANKNLHANSFIPAFATTATAAATTTLLVGSAYIQEFTGSTTQILALPVTSTLIAGQGYYVINNSSGVVTVNSSGGNLVQAMAAGTSLWLTCISTALTTAAAWQSSYINDAGGSVSSGLINQLAWYAATGNTVSGLTTANSAVLVTSSGGVPSLSSTMTNGQVIIGSTGATPTAAALTSGTGISITNAAGSITIASGGLSGWSGIAGTSQTAAVNTGYVVQNAGQTTITLPVTAPLGSIVSIAGLGAAGWVLLPGAGQTIQVDSAVVATSATSTNLYDQIEVVCLVANTTWGTRFVVSAGLTIV